ncbi:MAG: hypothetical protein NZ518_09635 [Dehalococcoidia bacterium]|nr:hypothetical protein [Dehalococcoidia bacterium]
MTTLTAQQQADIRADLGIPANDQTVFTDAEFNRLYERAGGDYNQTVVLALRQLLADAAKRNSYTAGQTSEKLDELFKNLYQLLDYYETRVLQGSKQIKIVGSRPVPYEHHDLPYSRDIGMLKRRRSRRHVAY